MIKPVGCQTDGYRGYLQALDDFGINKWLLHTRVAARSLTSLRSRDLDSLEPTNIH